MDVGREATAGVAKNLVLIHFLRVGGVLMGANDSGIYHLTAGLTLTSLLQPIRRQS